MNKTNVISGVKIVMAMIVALIVAFFIPSNPRSAFLFFAKAKNNFIALFFQKTSYAKLAETPLSAMTQMSKGVYAKEDKELKTIYIRVTKDAEWEEKIIESNGYRILLRSIKQ